MGAEEFGLEVTIHAHAGGYVEFEDELEAVIDAIDPALLGVCLDTGHSLYAGFDPIDFYERHADASPTCTSRTSTRRCGRK